MDTLSFISAIVESVAWPIAVVVGLLLLRKPIAELIPHLSELKWKDLSLVFNKGVAAAKAELPAPSSKKALPAPIEAESNRLRELAEISPRAAVLESWVALESAALLCLSNKRLLADSTRFHGHGRIAVALQSAGVFGPSEVSVFHKLRELRGKAAHLPDFALTTDDAIEYVEVSERLRAAIAERS